MAGPGRRREAQRAAYGGRCGAGGREVAGPRREPGQMPGLAPPAHPGAVGVGGWERALGGPRSLWVLSPSPKGFEPRWAGRGPRTTPQTVDCWVPGMRGHAQPVLLERGPEPGLEGSCPQRGVASPRWGQGDTLQAPGGELFSTLYHLSVMSWPQSRGHSGYTAAGPEAPTQAPPPAVQSWGAHAEAWGQEAVLRASGTCRACLSPTLSPVTVGKPRPTAATPLTELPEPNRAESMTQASSGASEGPAASLLGGRGWGQDTLAGRPPGSREGLGPRLMARQSKGEGDIPQGVLAVHQRPERSQAYNHTLSLSASSDG